MALAGLNWKTLWAPVLVTGLCLWLAVETVGWGLAERLEVRGRGEAAADLRPNSSVALALEAEALADRGDTAAADQLARSALRQSPLQANALRRLALSASAAGRSGEAEALMTRSAKLDPRDSKVQSWLMERALARRDFADATNRADSLMRRSEEARGALSFALLPLLRDAQARTAMAGRLAFMPPWRASFVKVAQLGGSTDDVASLFLAMKSTAAPATDVEWTPVMRRIVTSGDYGGAQALRREILAGQKGLDALVYDGGFEGLPGPPPLNWDAAPRPGGSAVWKTPEGVPMGILQLRHDGFRSSTVLARQVIFLPPGRYEVEASARIDEPAASGRFKIQAVCIGGPKLDGVVLEAKPGRWLESHGAFIVPADGCEAQWLEVQPVMMDRAEPVEMTVDNIRLRPLEASAGAQP